jgi:hypothetical protein
MFLRLRYLFEQANDAPDAGAAAAAAPADGGAAPADGAAETAALSAKDEILIRNLQPEQAKTYRENAMKKAKAAKAAPKAAEEKKPEEGAKAKADGANADEGTKAADTDPSKEVLQFGEEGAAPEGDPKPAEGEELSAEELEKLDAKTRRRIEDASKEAAKVRKRAQEAEAKLADLEKNLKEQTEAAARAVTLAGNAFAKFTDEKAVAGWAENAQEAVALLRAHERAVKAGKADKDTPIEHVLPNGETVELSLDKLPTYEKRVTDAGEWLAAQETLQTDATEAEAIVSKYGKLEGFTEARKAYEGSAPKLQTLIAKAAMYDVLQSRKATITFPGKAGAATKAPDEAANPPEKAAAPKKKPTESPPAQPRLERGDDEIASLQARKSALMERARTATGAQRTRLINEAISIRIPVRKAA